MPAVYLCDRHGLKYPIGGTCPECKRSVCSVIIWFVIVIIAVFVVLALTGCGGDPPQPVVVQQPVQDPTLVDVHDADGKLLGVGQVFHGEERADGTVQRMVAGPNGMTGKYVVGKHQAVETRVSWVDTLTRDGVVTKPISVYYLVAEDDTYCEVKMTDFFKAKEGHMWYSKHWRKD